MGCIYSITNKKNKKVYIGQTTNFKKRKKDHICNAKDNKIQTHLYNAMRKYGIENFQFEIVEDNIEQKDLNEKEIFYIAKFDTYNKGYNMTYGGENVMINNPEVKEKISNKIKKAWGNGVYNYRKPKIEKAMKKAHEKASERAKKMWQNEETRKTICKKIRESRIIPVIAVNDKENIYFKSYGEAVEFLIKKGYKANNAQICRYKNKNKQVYGYYWKGLETIERVTNRVE